MAGTAKVLQRKWHHTNGAADREPATSLGDDEVSTAPPTQSQKPKTLAESIPKAFVLSKAVEHAMTCFAMAFSLFNS